MRLFKEITMNTVHTPSNDANTPPEAQPVLSANGRPVQVVSPADGACLIEIVADAGLDSESKLQIMNWLTGLQPATLFDDPAQA